jgi:hypothetical protein
VGLRGRLRRLQKAAEREMIEVPQKDGTIKRFPQSAAKDAFMNVVDRLGAGDDAPPEHPLVTAARNSSDPEWSQSFYAAGGEGWTDPVEDLSE